MRDRAERQAQRLLKEQKITKPPVPVDRLPKELGIDYAAEDLDPDVSAILYREGERALILVNKRHSHTRQRFSVAHEIGHFLLHSGPVFVDKPVRVNFRDDRSSLGTASEEIQANRFAAALLMPEQWVVARASRVRNKYPDDEAFLKQLAQIFGVSREAIQYRLANLGLAGTV